MPYSEPCSAVSEEPPAHDFLDRSPKVTNDSECEILIQEYANEHLRIYPPDIYFCEDQAFDFLETETRFHPLFRNVSFQKPILLQDKRFPRGISFVNCTFNDVVSFRRSVFDGPAYFWNCRFEHTFDFFHAVVKLNRQAIQLREPGEVNFSYCWFKRHQSREGDDFTHPIQPSLDRAVFEGPAFFHRTVFMDGLSAEECRFKGGARFEDFESDVCLHKTQIATTLLQAVSETPPRMLFPNTDHDDHVDFDWNVRTERSLDQALVRSLREARRRAQGAPSEQKIVNTGLYRLRQSITRAWKRLRGIPEETPEQLRSDLDFGPLRVLWRERKATRMFGGLNAGKEAHTLSSFRGAHFGSGSHFSYVDLSNCRFQAANLEDIDFRVVRWVRQPCGLLFRRILGLFADIVQKPPALPLIAWRSAVRDELEIDLRISQYGNADGQYTSRRTELSELYRELRIAYDREGDRKGTRDFYFGELEAQRLASSRLARWFGMLHIYKIFSGYSKREGIAFAWLLFFMLFIFPAGFYKWLNANERDALTKPDPTFGTIARSWTDPPSSVPRSLLSLAPGCRLSPLTASSSTTDNNAKRSSPSTADLERFDSTMERALDAVDGTGSFQSRASRALASSMQASTFISTSAQAGNVENAIQVLQSVHCDSDPDKQRFYDTTAAMISGRENRRHFLEGLERLVVPAQLALVLLALRSKFQRS